MDVVHLNQKQLGTRWSISEATTGQLDRGDIKEGGEKVKWRGNGGGGGVLRVRRAPRKPSQTRKNPMKKAPVGLFSLLVRWWMVDRRKGSSVSHFGPVRTGAYCCVPVTPSCRKFRRTPARRRAEFRLRIAEVTSSFSRLPIHARSGGVLASHEQPVGISFSRKARHVGNRPSQLLRVSNRYWQFFVQRIIVPIHL